MKPKPIKKTDIERIRNWKQMPEKTKQSLRESWKTLDRLCLQNEATPGLLESLEGGPIKGCLITEAAYRPIQKFIAISKQVDNQIDTHEVNYAVKLEGKLRWHYHYETDGTWHHIKLIDLLSLEDDHEQITLEHHFSTDRENYVDGHYKADIEPMVIRMERIRKTKDAYEIQQMLDIAREISKQSGEPITDEYRFRTQTHRLARKTIEQYDFDEVTG